jgi:hypothetical protein
MLIWYCRSRLIDKYNLYSLAIITPWFIYRSLLATDKGIKLYLTTNWELIIIFTYTIRCVGKNVTSSHLGSKKRAAAHRNFFTRWRARRQHAHAPPVVKPANKIFALTAHSRTPYPRLNATHSTATVSACADRRSTAAPALALARVGCHPEQRRHPSLAPAGVGCRPEERRRPDPSACRSAPPAKSLQERCRPEERASVLRTAAPP